MIKIQVMGTVNSGKTTISNLIARYLKMHGFNVTLKDYDGIEVGDVVAKIESLKDKGISIEIETIQTHRTRTYDPTHVVSKAITTCGVVWPIGQFLQLVDGKLYDQNYNCESYIGLEGSVEWL